MGRLADVALVVWTHFLGFDLFIFIIAAVNLYCYIMARDLSQKLYKALHMIIFLPEYALTNEKKAPSPMPEAELVDLRKRENGFYSVFVNITGIFPLLGILGTVISLIPMVAELENMQQNFFTALTSTFWGLVYAIIYKFLDGFLCARIEENNTNVALFLERNKRLVEEAPCETKA